MAGHKNWAIGEEVVQSDYQGYVADQIVAQYASAAARASGWPTPPAGAVSVLNDHPGVLYYYNGSAWLAMGAGLEMARAVMTAQQNLTGSPFDIFALDVTWTAVPSRIYLTEVFIPVLLYNGAGNSSSFWGLGTRPAAGGAWGTMIRECTAFGVQTLASHINMSVRETGLSGPQTRGFRYNGGQTNNWTITYSAAQYGEMRVRDIGST